MAWKDEGTIRAIQQYVRIVTAVALAIVLLYLLVGQRIDIDTVVRIIVGLLMVDRAAMATLTRGSTKD